MTLWEKLCCFKQNNLCQTPGKNNEEPINEEPDTSYSLMENVEEREKSIKTHLVLQEACQKPINVCIDNNNFEYEEKILQLTEEIEISTRRNNKLRKEIKEKQQTINVKNRTINSLKDMNVELTMNSLNLENRCNILMNKNKELNTKIKFLHERIDYLTNDNEYYMHSVERYKEKISKKDKYIQDMEIKLSEN